MMDVFLAVLAALVVRDLIRWGAAKLDWYWSVNRMFTGGVPVRVQVVRALAGKTPLHGRG